MQGLFYWRFEGTAPADVTANDVGREELADWGPWEDIPSPAPTLPGSWRRPVQETLVPPLIVVGACPSCLDLAWMLAETPVLPPWASVLALHQWAGRGRQQRAWDSPRGNLYAAWRLPRPDESWQGLLPLLVAFILADCLAEFGPHLTLKWPNDLLLKGKKVGGILIEEKEGVVMAGVGLNLISAPPLDRLRHEQAVPAGCVAEAGYTFTPLVLWRQLAVDARERHLEIISTQSPGQFARRLERYLAFLNQDVIVSPTDEPEFRATVTGVEPEGGLRVRIKDRERVVRSGSIHPVVCG